MGLFRRGKVIKKTLFRSQDLKNSTTGCEEMAKAVKSCQKSIKMVTFPTLSDTS